MKVSPTCVKFEVILQTNKGRKRVPGFDTRREADEYAAINSTPDQPTLVNGYASNPLTLPERV